MGPKKGGKKGKGKGKKKNEGPEGPTPAELLAQIAVINVAKDKETQERNLMMLERVRKHHFTFSFCVKKKKKTKQRKLTATWCIL